MDLLARPNSVEVKRVALFPGSFNPPTRAHVALAHAALDVVDEVVFVLPKALPHKSYGEASFEQRIGMLRGLCERQPFAVAVSEGGLMVEITRECRPHYGSAEVYILCGRDAAERVMHWDYGEPGAFGRMIEEFHLLVAPREGYLAAPLEFSNRIHSLQLGGYYDEDSATRIREAIAKGDAWRHLVPDAIAAEVARIYSVNDRGTGGPEGLR